MKHKIIAIILTLTISVTALLPLISEQTAKASPDWKQLYFDEIKTAYSIDDYEEFYKKNRESELKVEEARVEYYKSNKPDDTRTATREEILKLVRQERVTS